MRFLLINSISPDPFCAIYDGHNLSVSRVSDFIKTAVSQKSQDKFINCLHYLAERHNLQKTDTISVVVGPGSFTGIRVGVAIAKGLSLALDKKIIPVTNFELILNRLSNVNLEKKYCVLIPAKLVPAGFKQGPPEYYYAFIQGAKELNIGYIQISDISSILDKDTVLVGDFDNETMAKLNYLDLFNVKDMKPEPDSMLELSIKHYNEGQLHSPNTIVPLYIKDFVIKKR